MIDMAFAAYPAHEPLRKKVRAERIQLDAGLEGMDAKTVDKRLRGVAGLMKELVDKAELSGPVYEDLIHLKSIYSRYRNYAEWLRGYSGQVSDPVDGQLAGAGHAPGERGAHAVQGALGRAAMA